MIPTTPTDLFIDGTWRKAANAGTFQVEDPATQQVIAEVADADVEDAKAAAAAAAAALPAWSRRPPRERAEILRRAYELVIGAKEQLAALITAENGKARADAEAEVVYAAEFFRWYSEEAVRIDGHLSLSPAGDKRIIEISQPVGVSLLLTPWNLPAAMVTRKVAPAIAAGCSVVVKPSWQTPLTALFLARLLAEAGVPAGVVNVVPTSRDVTVTAELVADGPVRALSFTGSTRVGSALLAQAAERVLKTSMELGGNAPFLVFEDADIDAAVAGALVAKMRHNAEACTAANRFYVHGSVHDEFVSRLADGLSALEVGPGTVPSVQVGPMASASARDALGEAVQSAVDSGGRVVLGGSAPDGTGYYFPPTLIDDVPPNAPVLGHELFGPVAPIVSFDTEDEAISMANSTEMGLGSYVYTQDLRRGLGVAERLESGMVGLNTGVFSDPAAPFGGIKQSGIGREGGRHGIHEFLETKYIATQW
ncbi:succinate-semialdehyde dehydrogenase / glutarate-semialdehyde dehydrogenase [Streptomyces sp. 3213]|uniref:NAD-dependent succinate-semialdehyde dehydrogenase n=1 Tax=Streptomyces sp. 3213.3 TaxID=1855348 RepID=UPI000897053E|nr:NAD-dependent succinate-semialdehyde dehydrogenase [Streptomyces sp. 3213.3]SEE79340.1 succinate-semialdehyde dehydrogenase / glutarate-semialdehyde dehydrogenase [Streptomyces sp. 3213] [Streptomyces sp. 3213.3]